MHAQSDLGESFAMHYCNQLGPQLSSLSLDQIHLPPPAASNFCSPALYLLMSMHGLLTVILVSHSQCIAATALAPVEFTLP